MPENIADQQRLRAWLELIDAGECLARAGIRARLEPGGDEDAEYFRVVRKHSDEHQAAILDFAREFSRRVGNAGKITPD